MQEGRSGSSSLSLIASAFSRLALRHLLLSAELGPVVAVELAATECVGDVDDPVAEETPRSLETSLMSKQSIFLASARVTLWRYTHGSMAAARKYQLQRVRRTRLAPRAVI